MAHIEKRNSRWRARYRAPDGRERSRTFDRKTDASVGCGRFIPSSIMRSGSTKRLGRITFSDWVDRYSQDRRSSGRPYRPTTAARDRAVARRWLVPHLGKCELSAITRAAVDDLVADMREHLAPSTVRTNYGVLRAMMTRAVDTELIGRSPCRGIDMPAARAAEPRFLSVDELHRLADSTPADYRMMIYLGGVVGLRWSEVAGLRVGRVDFLGRSVTVAETLAEVEGRLMFAEPKSACVLPRPSACPRHWLMAWPSTSPAVGGPSQTSWCSSLPRVSHCGRPTSVDACGHPQSRRPGLDGLTFHGLRHTAAGLMIELGAHPKVIQQRLGHASIRTTMDVYGKVLPEVDDGVTDGLGGLLDQAGDSSAASPRPQAIASGIRRRHAERRDPWELRGNRWWR